MTGRNLFRTRRGSAIIEFALAGSFIFLPLLAGMSTVGFQMVKALQVANVTRDAAHLLSTGAISIGSPNQPLLQKMAGSLSLSDGNGGILLTEFDGTSNGTVMTQVSVGVGAVTSKYGQPPFTPQTGQSIYIAESYFSTPTIVWSGLMPGTGGGIYSKAIF